MKIFHRNKKVENISVFTELDYSVLNYEQLLKVNGAKGSGNPSGPSGGNGGDNTNNDSTSNTQIDNSNNPTIVQKFTESGYEQLSDKKDSTYTEGSRKDYIQSEFEIFNSDSDSFSVIKTEGRFEGVSNGTNSYTDYDSYTIITKDGRVVMEAIDVNGDGKVDFVR